MSVALEGVQTTAKVTGVRSTKGEHYYEYCSPTKHEWKPLAVFEEKNVAYYVCEKCPAGMLKIYNIAYRRAIYSLTMDELVNSRILVKDFEWLVDKDLEAWNQI